METGAITQYIDVAQIVLYLFWAFFFGLIYYLIREGHREGYPMDTSRPDGTPGPKVMGWPVPEPKVYKLANGHEVLAPDFARLDSTYHAEPGHAWAGAPLEPVGDPLLAGVGPGAWAARADVPDLTADGRVKIVPLRSDTAHGVARQDVDPRGLPVFGKDGEVAGHIKEMWVDRSEMLFRYMEIQLQGDQEKAHTVLVPMPFCRVKKDGVTVLALLAAQFAKVPTTRHPDEITLLEEEKISAYYGAGLLYATADIQEPLF